MTVGLGVVALLAVLLAVRPRLRRFSRAAARLRSDLADGTAALPAVRWRRG
ncbi:hypothetical protein [Pseudonocardia sp.]|uniref:hypothetical protein n=1 Tax=Pseudonocardia sp. TaxID=60912 RepID=UPI00261EAD61|nr:hypothetical protein [Pseudonocardia sp.]